MGVGGESVLKGTLRDQPASGSDREERSFAQGASWSETPVTGVDCGYPGTQGTLFRTVCAGHCMIRARPRGTRLQTAPYPEEPHHKLSHRPLSGPVTWTAIWDSDPSSTDVKVTACWRRPLKSQIPFSGKRGSLHPSGAPDSWSWQLG